MACNRIRGEIAGGIVGGFAHGRDESLRGGDGVRARRAQFFRDAFDGSIKLIGGDNFMHQADLFRTCGAEALAGEKECARVRTPDFRQNERRDHCRNDAELGLGEAKECILRGDDDIADSGEARAAAERGPVDARDDGLGAAIDRPKHIAHRGGIGDVTFLRKFERRAHPLHVRAAAENTALTAEDHRTHAFLAFELREGLAQFAHKLVVEGVTHVGARKRDAGDLALGGKVNGRWHGRRFLALIRRGLGGVQLSEMPHDLYRYSIAARLAHWLWVLAFLVLVSSGLQIFNAAPYLDAADQSNPARRVLAIDAPQPGIGSTTIAGHTFTTTGWLGWTPDGMGGQAARAFPSWITIPAYQDLADGRRWHLFFAWGFSLAWLTWLLSSALKGNLQKMVLRPSDLRKLWPMQAYYLRVRREPPPYDIYNPLQKAAYTIVAFGLFPLLILTGLALSPGIDSMFPWLTQLFGGRQFARLWHFAGMLALIGFFVMHTLQVATQGVVQQMRSMITGWYRPSEHEQA